MEMLVLPSWRFLMPHTEGYEFITAAVTRLNSEESERTGGAGGPSGTMEDLRLSSIVQQEYGFLCYPKAECSYGSFVS